MRRTQVPTVTGILNTVSGAFVLVGGIATALGTPVATAVVSYVMYA